MSRHFVAPGKAVVAGEYAVIDGAPALVAAVNVGVQCTVSPGPRRRVTTDAPDTRFVDAALDAADAPPGDYAFTAWNPPPTATKPGLGSSAAATVVAVAAARSLRGHAISPHPVFDIAAPAHHRVQGSGSGIDVAASCWGGLIRFTRGTTPVPTAPLRLLVIWSGQSAATGPRVEAYQAWPGRPAFARSSRELVDAFLNDPIEGLRANHRLLQTMTTSAGIDWATPALDRIHSLALQHGGAAKPSGAGGGDCAVAIMPDPDAEAAFLRACAAEGFPALATSLERGVSER